MVNLLSFIFLIYSSSSSATGWNDYNLELGDGYSISRANAFDVYLTKSSKIVVSNYNFDEIGPITYYYKNPRNIFIQTAGRKFRNLFDGDTFREIDRSKEFYFIVALSDGKIKGPLSRIEFDGANEVTAVVDLKWVSPQNPNFWEPLAGSLMFLCIAIIAWYAKYWFVTVPVTIALVYIFARRSKQRRNSRKNRNKSSAQP